MKEKRERERERERERDPQQLAPDGVEAGGADLGCMNALSFSRSKDPYGLQYGVDSEENQRFPSKGELYRPGYANQLRRYVLQREPSGLACE